MISAYNSGAGAVLRVFDEDKDEAIYKINQMYPEQSISHLNYSTSIVTSKKLLAESGCSSEEIPCKTIISEIKYHARKTFLSGIIFL